MNRPIVRLYGLVVLLFALLLVFTSRWTVFEASSLRENRFNARGLLEQQRIDRGRILADNGTVLARSVRGPEGTYRRVYPTGEEFAHAVGYSYVYPDLGQTGTERYRNAVADGPDGQEPAVGARPAAGQEAPGRRRLHDARPVRATRGDLGARRTSGRGGRARSAHRSGQGDGIHARPMTPTRCALSATMKSSPRTLQASRWSTVPPSSAMPPARPSRSSPPPPRSTRAPTRRNPR